MLSYDYTMELDFEGGAAKEHSFTLRCLPQETEAQHIHSVQLQIDPAAELSYGRDSFGNRYCYGVIHEQHTCFRVDVQGMAERYPERHETASEAAQMLYRQQTARTMPGPALRKMMEKKGVWSAMSGGLEEVSPVSTRLSPEADPGEAGTKEQESWQTALRIRDLVHDSMTYVPGATSPATSAEEAAASGKGVCQDYAHIMLALCRMEGIPCRYTAGLLPGEGASHAWVEVCDHGLWKGLDPTNPSALEEDKLIFSHGRDAEDCEINRGIYLGPQAQVQKISALLMKE